MNAWIQGGVPAQRFSAVIGRPEPRHREHVGVSPSWSLCVHLRDLRFLLGGWVGFVISWCLGVFVFATWVALCLLCVSVPLWFVRVPGAAILAGMSRGYFITFEGGEGTGKSTQLMLVDEWLRTLGHTTVVTREPGGTPLAEAVRALLLDPELEPDGLSEIFLLEAARRDHGARGRHRRPVRPLHRLVAGLPGPCAPAWLGRGGGAQQARHRRH